MESKPVAREGCGQQACVCVCARMYDCVCASEQRMAVLQLGRSCEYNRPIGLVDYRKICPYDPRKHSDSHVVG